MKNTTQNILRNSKYFIFGLAALIFVIGISYLVSYQSKPSFSPPLSQSGIFQDPDQIDTTIRPVSLSKYPFQNNNSLHRTSFKKDPTLASAINFANKYTSLSFYTNSKQNFALANTNTKPIAKDSSVTYLNIFPDTDLKYTVEPDRLLEEFIVHKEETALEMTRLTQTLDIGQIDIYKEVGGTIELYKDDKLVATVPKPVMYEHNDNSKKSYDLSYEIQKINQNTLEVTKVIDDKGIAWLKSPKRIYPIVIDLVIDNADTSASWVSSDTASTVVTQETTIKQEGTGSVKVTTTDESTTTADLMEYATDSAAQTAYVSNDIIATGGVITYDGAYTVHTFIESGTFTVSAGSGTVEALVVGGGGGTGSRYQGGGGGGGGIVYHSGYSVTAQGYSITVGAGGSGSSVGAQTQTSGGNSVFGNMTAYGGGRGGSESVARSNGGSGGGSSHYANESASSATQGVNGTARYGNNGGATIGSNSSPFSAPGGGGAGAASSDVSQTAGSPGNGGVGVAFSISGSSVYYGGGGAGSNRTGGTASGGNGGGGNTGQSGTANTGGGGGAGSDQSTTRVGGAGGSGVVIIKYPTSIQSYSSLSGITATGGTISYSGDDTIHTFNSSGTFTVSAGSGTVEALVVGGGGGAGAQYQGSGGGGGGIVYHSGYSVTAQGYSITVGAGGSGSSVGASSQTSGSNSVFGNMTAYGGGRGGSEGRSRENGGSGGGGSHNGNHTASTGTKGVNGIVRYGNNGGANAGSSHVAPFSAPGGGGAGAASSTVAESAASPGNGGVGVAFSISGSSVYYGGGGAGSNRTGGTASGGNGGGGNTGQSGTANTGGGGGAGSHVVVGRAGGAGGKGVVIIRYPTPINYKSQGSYSLKGVATTNAISETLTRTVSPTLDLSGHNTINFDLRSTRTGSNIKIGIHDSGGTTTEITPNITSADAFQTVEWDISGVSNANKDAIDSIIITIVNADAANTFHIDDMTATDISINDTVTLTKSSTDLSGQDNITYWVRSDTTGSFARLEFGESASSEQTNAFTINSANTWEQKTWDITGITGTSRDAVTKFAFKLTSDTNGAILYFDDIQTTQNNYTPSTPSLDLPSDTATNQILLPVLKTTTTDSESDYIRYKIELCEDVGMSVSCQTFDQTSSQTGWSGQNAETSTAYASGTQSTYTLQTPLADNDTFYWRSYAIDPGGTNTWSSTQGTPYSFTTTAAPTAPTTLYTEGSSDPANVIDLTPEFSAIHNDADGDSADYYQIVVDTAVGFDGVEMWDSGKVSMTTTADGVRSPDISYAGTSLSLDDSVYYWKIKFWDTIGAEGTYSVTANFGMNILPNTPSLDLPADTAAGQSLLADLKTTSTDADSDYLRYKIELCEDLSMTVSCQTFDQTSSQTGWSGQDAQSTTAYASGTQSIYTLQSALAVDSTYYWRSYVIDPAGANTWSSTQGTPYSFTTNDTPVKQSDCRVQESNNDSSLTIVWTDTATNEDGYEVQRSVDSGAFSVLITGMAANSITHQDSTITTNHTYRYKVAPYITGPVYGDWCYTNILSISLGSFTFENITFE